MARVIPVLLLENKGLVKTVKFKDPKYIGDPINAVKLFNDLEVDELILVDIEASRLKREPDFEYLREITSECFMPVGYAGGVTNTRQIQKLVQSGIEKIVLNNSLFSQSGFLNEVTNAFGASTIVAGVDVKKNLFGQFKVYDHVKRSITSLSVVDHCMALEDMGAGELFINNVDADGVMCGYDLNLIKSITEKVSIPVISCGGCGSFADIREVINASHASAAAAGSFFIYQGPHKAVLISYLTRTQLESIS
jgi:cyclase